MNAESWQECHMHDRLVSRFGSTDPMADEKDIVNQIDDGRPPFLIQKDGRVQYLVDVKGEPAVVVVGHDGKLITILDARVVGTNPHKRQLRARWLRKKAKRNGGMH